jgi:ATP-GRASP peptide maturase of grasp-with-spasm system
MVLIFSNANDPSTDKVIDWLYYFGTEFIRINEIDFYDFIQGIFLSNEELKITFSFNGQERFLSEVTAVWFRRHLYSANRLYEKMGNKEYFIKNDENDVALHLDQKNSTKIKNNIDREFRVIRDYVFSKLQKCPIVLGHWKENHENKLMVLDAATSVGLLIPDTALITSQKQLLEQKERKGRLITKCLSYAPSFIMDELGKPISNYTSEVYTGNEDNLKLANRFFGSLIQKKVDKRIEIRVFYLDGIFYSMAIFSQQSSETKIDFRNYDWETPNRCVPYKLPMNIEEKLSKLMALLKLNTGSIDLIVNTTGEYIFLEVNPVGQFGMVSSPCNYYLEREIARFLSN